MAAFTLFHVALSLIGIGSGFVVIWGLLAAKRLEAWTAVFLAATVLTSVTGFLFPINGFTPGHAVGILSLIALGIALFARYRMGMAGGWRSAYVISAVVSQYFNFVVLIIQSFQKVPVLESLAPTPAELRGANSRPGNVRSLRNWRRDPVPRRSHRLRRCLKLSTA